MRNSWKSWLLFLSLSVVSPGCQQVSERIAAWRDDRGGKESQVAGDIYEAGRLEREGKLAEARDLYGKVHAKDPENFHAVHRLAVVSTQLKEETVAKEYFEKALKLNPKDPVLLADMGYALALQEDFPNAERALRLSLKEDPKSERTKKSLGRVLAQQGKSQEALDVLREVYPEDQANVRVAGYLIQQKKYAEADKHLLAAKEVTQDEKLRAEIDQQLARKERPAPGVPAQQQLAANQPAAVKPANTQAEAPGSQKIDIPPSLQEELRQVQPASTVAQTQPAAAPAPWEVAQPQTAQAAPATPATTGDNPFASLAAKQTPAAQQPASENPFATLGQQSVSANPFAETKPAVQLATAAEPALPSTPESNPFEQKPVQPVAQVAVIKPVASGPALVPKSGALKPHASSPFIYPFAESEESLLARVTPAVPRSQAPAVPAAPASAPPQTENPFAELAQATPASPQQPVPQQPGVTPATEPAPWEEVQPAVLRTASNSRLVPTAQEPTLAATNTEPAFDEQVPAKLAEDTGSPLEVQPPLARPAQPALSQVMPFPVLDFGWRAAEVDGSPQFGEKGWQNYCPVELRENRQLAHSSEKFTSTHAGKVYRFSSRQSRDLFNADPERYIAAAGGMDVVKFQQDGVKVDGSLAFARWYQDKLFFFTSQETLDVFIEDPTRFTHLID